MDIIFLTFVQSDKNKKTVTGRSVGDMLDQYANESSYFDVLKLNETNIKHCSKTYDASKSHYNPENGYNVTYDTIYDKNKKQCYLRKLKTYKVPKLSHIFHRNYMITYAIDKNTQTIAGYLKATKIDMHHVYVSEILIHKKYRGKDLCGKLISKFVKYVEQNIPTIYIYSLVDATAIVNSGYKIGDFCYNKTFSKLGYIRDLRTDDTIKVFTKYNYMDTKQKMNEYNQYLRKMNYIYSK